MEALARVDRALRDHAIRLRRTSAVTSANARLEPVLYESGHVLEGYVEATLANGDAVCWCLDVRWSEESWIIEATLDRKAGDRQEIVEELPLETGTDLAAFIEALNRVVRELLALSASEQDRGS